MRSNHWFLFSLLNIILKCVLRMGIASVFSFHRIGHMTHSFHRTVTQRKSTELLLLYRSPSPSFNHLQKGEKKANEPKWPPTTTTTTKLDRFFTYTSVIMFYDFSKPIRKTNWFDYSSSCWNCCYCCCDKMKYSYHFVVIKTEEISLFHSLLFEKRLMNQFTKFSGTELWAEL